MQQTEFDQLATDAEYQPLADRLRPKTITEFFGQSHILGENKPLIRAIQSGHVHSMVLWGPPGTGKTTLAKLVAKYCDAEFLTLSAVLSGVKEIRATIDEAKRYRQSGGKTAVLFVDEVHRFNKAQQDAFLPHIEDGTIIFIGATTENPSFELNSALLSRARVYVLRSLDETEILNVIDRAITDKQFGYGRYQWHFDIELRRKLALAADGDARRALNLVEILFDLAEREDNTITVSEEILDELFRGSHRRFDKGGDVFYDQISALHKSVRGSAPDAALYWYARMLDGGCDPLYVARRLVAIASEDIGNADPRALELALNAWDAFERLGAAEGERAIAHAIVYLSSAPKSNAIEVAFHAAKDLVRKTGSLEVPLHLRNAPTKLMASMKFGAEYRYAHNEEHNYAAGENYFPEEIHQRKFYKPSENGLEAKIKARLEFLKSLDEQSRRKRYSD